MGEVKFSEFPLLQRLTSKELIPVVQDKENKNIMLGRLSEAVNVFNAAFYGLSPANDGAENSKILQFLVNTASEFGGTIYIPAGEYVFSASGSQTVGQHCIKMKSNVHITGEGERTVLLPSGYTQQGLDMFYYNELADSGTYEPLRNCSFENFVIDGKGTSCASYTSAGKGFMINVFQNCHWKNVTVRNTDATGFGMDCPIDSSIVNCIAENCGKAAQITDAGASGFGIGFGAAYEENLFISRCRSSGNKKFGFFFEHQRRFDTGKYTATSNKGFIISECTADENYNNFGGIQAANVQYRNCFSKSAVQHGYMFENSQDCNVVACYSVMEGNTSFVVLSSDIDGGGQEVKDISYNQCISKYTSYGAKVVQYGSTAAVTRNLIKDCYFDASIINTIYTSGTMDSLIIQGNTSNGANNNFGATVSTLVDRYNSWN